MEIYLKNVDKTKYLKDLKPCPSTVDHFVLFISMLDPFNLLVKRDPRDIRKLSTHHLDLLYLLTRTNYLIHTQYIDSITDYIIVHLLTILSSPNHDANVMLRDQLFQDISHIMESMTKTDLTIDPDTIKDRLYQAIGDILSNDYGDLINKKPVLAKHDKMFSRMAVKIATHTKNVMIKSQEISRLIVNKIFDSLGRRDSIESMVMSFEKMFDLESICATCDIIVVYGETVMNDKLLSLGSSPALL